jgi:hypothetical protein
MSPERELPLLNDDQRRELERRAAEDDARPDDVVPWQDVKTEALARQKQKRLS